MDKNQTIGLVLMSALLMVYMFWFSPQQTTSSTSTTDSTKTETVVQKEIAENQPAIALDSATQALIDNAKEIVLENEELKVTLSSLGAKIVSVELKNYQTYNKQPLILVDEKSSQLELSLPTSTGSVRLDKAAFAVVSSSATSATFQTTLNGETIEVEYNLPATGFELGYTVKANDQNKALQLSWTDALKRTDANLEYDRREATVNYYTTEGDFDYLSKGSQSAQSEKLENPVRWFSMKQRFFNAALLTDKEFTDLTIGSAQVNEQDSSIIKILQVNAVLPLTALSKEANSRFYFGPNKFDINKKVAEGFQENTYLGWSVLAPVSRFIILPLFDVLENFISNYGILIIVMVFIIKMGLMPLTYKSYIAQARTKVLQPEIDKIKEKYPDDQAKQTQETMKLNGEFGINPLSGCVPTLLQMPIIFALFTFFPSAIQLRNESFLWASDLSTYDSILNLPFSIPFYGAHVSLFTLMMTASQILVTKYTTQQSQMSSANMPINPKMMMYGMPVMFMFVLNSFPAGLTLYYVTSNLITLLQTVVIRKFFVDEKKIRAKLEERKKERKSKGKSGGFMQRMQEAMQAAQEQQAQQQQSKNKKPKK